MIQQYLLLFYLKIHFCLALVTSKDKDQHKTRVALSVSQHATMMNIMFDFGKELTNLYCFTKYKLNHAIIHLVSLGQQLQCTQLNCLYMLAACLYLSICRPAFLHSKTPILSVTYSRGTVTTQCLDSDSVATIDNCHQHSDYTVDQLCSHRVEGS